MATTRTPGQGTATGVLTGLRQAQQVVNQGEIDKLQLALKWAAIHTTDILIGPLATWDEELALGGEGCPAVTEFCVAEFAAALNLSTDAGRAYLTDVIELRHRLPRLYDLTTAGKVPVWRARLVAKQTLGLPPGCVDFIDRQVAAVAGKIGPRQLERLVYEARVRYDTATLEAELDEYEEETFGRHVTFHDSGTDGAGTIDITGTLDVADAMDLKEAVTRTAANLHALGCTATPDVRRALALGEIARTQNTLDLNTTTPAAGTGEGDATPVTASPGSTAENNVWSPEQRPSRLSPEKQARADEILGDWTPEPSPVHLVLSDPSRVRARQVVLHVHLTDTALAIGSGIGRLENTQTPIRVKQVREWCTNPDTLVIVKPVIDLNGHIRTDAYEIPDRLREHVILRDGHCLFPWCTRNARNCDIDHVQPFAEGGATDDRNLGALCRHHHRLKTHAGWSYTMPTPGVAHWTSPHGIRFIVDHTGTTPCQPDP